MMGSVRIGASAVQSAAFSTVVGCGWGMAHGPRIARVALSATTWSRTLAGSAAKAGCAKTSASRRCGVRSRSSNPWVSRARRQHGWDDPEVGGIETGGRTAMPRTAKRPLLKPVKPITLGFETRTLFFKSVYTRPQMDSCGAYRLEAHSLPSAAAANSSAKAHSEIFVAIIGFGAPPARSNSTSIARWAQQGEAALPATPTALRG